MLAPPLLLLLRERRRAVPHVAVQLEDDDAPKSRLPLLHELTHVRAPKHSFDDVQAAPEGLPTSTKNGGFVPPLKPVLDPGFWTA